MFGFAVCCLILGILMLVSSASREEVLAWVLSIAIVFLIVAGGVFSVSLSGILNDNLGIKRTLENDALYHIHGNANHDILTMQRIDEERSEVVGPVFLYKIKKGEKVSEIIEPGYNFRYNYGVLERWPPSYP